MSSRVWVDGLTKAFGCGSDRLDIVDDVSVGVERPEFVGMLGPSGGGDHAHV